MIPPFIWLLGVAGGSTFLLAVAVGLLHSRRGPRRIGFYTFDKAENIFDREKIDHE